MKSLNEIHDMIQTAQSGDNDKLLDICQALLEQLREAHRIADHVAEVLQNHLEQGD